MSSKVEAYKHGHEQNLTIENTSNIKPSISEDNKIGGPRKLHKLAGLHPLHSKWKICPEKRVFIMFQRQLPREFIPQIWVPTTH